MKQFNFRLLKITSISLAILLPVSFKHLEKSNLSYVLQIQLKKKIIIKVSIFNVILLKPDVLVHLDKIYPDEICHLNGSCMDSLPQSMIFTLMLRLDEHTFISGFSNRFISCVELWLGQAAAQDVSGRTWSIKTP